MLQPTRAPNSIMEAPDDWDDSDNDWESNDAPTLAAAAPAPAVGEEVWSDEEEIKRGPEAVNYRGKAGKRAEKSALESKMEAFDARSEEEKLAEAASAALSVGDDDGLGGFTSAELAEMTPEQKRKAKKEAARHAKNAQAREFLKDGRLRDGASDDGPSSAPLAKTTYSATAVAARGETGRSDAVGPIYREEDAGDEVFITPSTASQDYAGPIASDAALASGRVANLNAGGILPPEPDPDAKEDKTKRTSKKEQARQKEREKTAAADKAKEDAYWAEGVKPTKK